MRDAGSDHRGFVQETGGAGGGDNAPPRPPPAVDSPGIRDSDDVAARVIAQGRGVAERWSWWSALVSAVRRWLVRLLALPLATAAGTLLGCAAALGIALEPTTWPTRLWRLPVALIVGFFGGLVAGARLAWKGKLIDTAQVAAIIHHWRPIITLPKSLTHHLFGLVFVTRYDDVKTVLGNGKVFAVDVYEERMRATTGAFFLGQGPGEPYQTEQKIGRAGVGTDLSRSTYCARPLTRALVGAASKRPTHTLDVMSELLHPVITANLECFFGVPDTADQRVQTWLQTVSYYIFNFWVGGPYRAAAVNAGTKLGQHLLDIVTKRAAAGSTVAIDALDRMLEQSRDFPLIARTLGGLIAGATGPLTVVFPAIVDRLLGLPAVDRRRLRLQCGLAPEVGHQIVEQYVLEAARLAPAPPLIYRHAATAYAFCGGEKNATVIERGAFVVTAPILANLDASKFPRPGEFEHDRKYTRGANEPMIFGWGQHACLGNSMGLLLLTEMITALFARDVRRFAGPAGQPTKGPAGAIPEGDYTQRFIVELR